MQRRVVELFVAVVAEAHERALPVPARRADDIGRVVDVEIDEALVVEPQHPASVGVAIEPAPEGSAQAVVGDLGALVPEAPFAVETDAALPQLLDLGVAELHLSCRATGAASNL